jgi:ankyrin repeat protein
MKRLLVLSLLLSGQAVARPAIVISPRDLQLAKQESSVAARLLTALEGGDVLAFAKLLSLRGADVNYIYADGQSLLDKAINTELPDDKNAQIIHLLVEAGIDLKPDDALWATEKGLLVAVAAGSQPLLRVALSKFKNVSAYCMGIWGREASLFELAVEHGASVAILQMLLDAGVSLATGWPLHVALDHNDTAAVQFFLEKSTPKNGVDVNKQWFKSNQGTPLHWAIKRGNIRAVTLLVVHGAKSTVRDVSGLTPLTLARAMNRNDIADLLLGR